MVYQKCQETSGSLTQILDCRCISLKFLDKRVLDGPNTPQHLVVQGIDTKDCKSDAGIAGMMYDMCIQNFWFISGYEGMCECATKKATPNVMKYDIATERAVAVQMAEAMQACDPNWLTNGLLNKGTGSGTQQNSNQFQPPPKPQ